LPGLVLITGGAGFLGSHLVEVVRARGERVRILDCIEPPAWCAATGVEYLRGDVREPAVIQEAMQGAGAVIHAAFASPRQPRELMRDVNVEATRLVCEAALKRGARFVLISSTIVMRPARTHPFLGNSPLSRLDLYRSTRAEAEESASRFIDRGLSCAIVRPKTFLGPGRVSAFTILFERIRRGMAVPVLGSGANRYQLLHIRDMAEGIALLQDSAAQGIFHFGARQFGTVREDLQALVNHAGSGARLSFLPAGLSRLVLRAIELAGMTPAAEWHHMSAAGRDAVVDISRAEKELGWSARWSNSEALGQAYDWYTESLNQTGVAQALHPLPFGHRLLDGILRVFIR